MVKKILLIHPDFLKGSLIHFPTGMAIIAAILKNQGYDVSVFDANVENDWDLKKLKDILSSNQFDLIGISAFISQYGAVCETIRLIKGGLKTPVILGGNIVTGNAEFVCAQTKADFVLTGECEQLILKFLNAWQANDLASCPNLTFRKADGEIQSNPVETFSHQFDEIPMPAYDLFPIEKYVYRCNSGVPGKRTLNIESSRGCVYSCGFCIESNEYFDHKMRFKSPSMLKSEILYLKENFGIDRLSFSDELFAPPKLLLKELSNEIGNLGVEYVVTTRGEFFDEEYVDLLKQTNFVRIVFGIENVNEDMNKRMNKKTNLKKILLVIDLLKKKSINFFCLFLVGYPGETVKTIDENINFCKENGILWSPSIFWPIPGTTVFKECFDFIMKRFGDLHGYCLAFSKVDHMAPIDIPGMTGAEVLKNRNRGIVETAAVLLTKKLKVVPLFICELLAKTYLSIIQVEPKGRKKILIRLVNETARNFFHSKASA